MSSNKQRVLIQYPKAICKAVRPGHFQVDFGNGEKATVGGSTSSAWCRAAQVVGAQNAIDTISPFTLPPLKQLTQAQLDALDPPMMKSGCAHDTGEVCGHCMPARLSRDAYNVRRALMLTGSRS